MPATYQIKMFVSECSWIYGITNVHFFGFGPSFGPKRHFLVIRRNL